MKKCLFLLFFLVLFSFLFSSCKSSKRPIVSHDKFRVDFEPEYNINDDILIDISIGFCKEEKDQYVSASNLIFVLGYSKIEPTRLQETDEETILYTITDFSPDIYYYTKESDKVTYNFKENFVINNNIFTDDTGKFYIFFYFASKDRLLTCRNAGSMRYETIYYEKNNEILSLSYPPKENYGNSNTDPLPFEEIE